MSRKPSEDSYSKQETARRVEAALRAAFTTPHTIVEDCAVRIGNTCLTTEGGNLKAGGKSLSEKRTVFAASKLITTQVVAQQEEWNRQKIDHHQAYLPKLAAATWRFE